MSKELLPSMEEVDGKVNQSIAHLLERDKVLLQIDASERAISHRLALYLQLLFVSWDVDCEYNRDLGNPKKLYFDLLESLGHGRRPHTTPWDDTSVTVFPDIVVHKRMSPNNLLVIEIKKTTNKTREGDEFDRLKLREFKAQYGYHYALFLKFITGQDEIGVEIKEYI